jgi:hypothetical protein
VIYGLKKQLDAFSGYVELRRRGSMQFVGVFDQLAWHQLL